jgi:sugar lactone lactonase YvrE
MSDAKIDLVYRSTLRIGGKGAAVHQFGEALRGIAVGGDDLVYAVGDASVKVFDTDGQLRRQWKTALPGFSIAVDDDGRVWVGAFEQVEIFDAQGERVETWRRPGELGLITAIAFSGEGVFFADAGARWIHRYDRQGQLVNHIGDKHRKGGFHIPNGVVDFAIDDQGILHVANPGMHRVERYRADGELLGHIGRFDGRDPAGFGGCCNPTNVTLDRAGRIVVSEKAGPRAKVYSPEGELLAVIAADVFDPAAKNMDLAVDSRGRVYVADTATLKIHVFETVGQEVAP